MPLDIRTTVFVQGESKLAQAVRDYGINKAARDSKINVALVHRWLTGKRGLPIDRVQRIGRLLGLTIKFDGKKLTIREVNPKSNTADAAD